jgi:hypothetical protein
MEEDLVILQCKRMLKYNITNIIGPHFNISRYIPFYSNMKCDKFLHTFYMNQRTINKPDWTNEAVTDCTIISLSLISRILAVLNFTEGKLFSSNTLLRNRKTWHKYLKTV